MTPTSLAARTASFVYTAPGTDAGRYMRSFWQPVFHSVDLKPARPVPLKIMSQSFTLYRGATGPFLVDARCPHRGIQLSAGWVEGDDIRCFYHGWKFSKDGKCLEQPAEGSKSCSDVSIRSYPVREYLGLIFAYLGEGEPPEFPTYPEFEYFDGFVEVDSYMRECNYFQNLENALDMSHVGFVHGDNSAAFEGIGSGNALEAQESSWGVAYKYTRPDGQYRIQQFGMPNIFYMNALPTDPEIGWQESLFWWVPIDDHRHMQFSIHRVPAVGEAANRIHERRGARRGKITVAHQRVCDEILLGKLSLKDLDTSTVDLVRLQDDIAQVGQGIIADRDAEKLGRSDIGVAVIRRLWNREMKAFLAGQPLKTWQRSAEIVPHAWGLSGEATKAGGAGTDINGRVKAKYYDVRPGIETDLQLAALCNLNVIPVS